MAVLRRVMDQATYIVLGQYQAFGAYRKDRISGGCPARAGDVEHHQESSSATRRWLSREPPALPK